MLLSYDGNGGCGQGWIEFLEAFIQNCVSVGCSFMSKGLGQWITLSAVYFIALNFPGFA
jgi:hypothetical protein